MGVKATKTSRSQKLVGIGLPIILTLMVCLTVNYSTFAEWNKELSEQGRLEKQVEATIADNLALQEQIHFLRHDPATIEREVKRFGLRRPNKEVSVQTDR
ncbi:MAG TPA: hypothetical protein PKD26_09085 [Pyrinomonadaceae bacterium]|nr:hypothetical protein [Pyrinomonadaceae bacterium]